MKRFTLTLLALGLAAGFGHIGAPKFQVHIKIGKALPRHNIASFGHDVHNPIFDLPAGGRGRLADVLRRRDALCRHLILSLLELVCVCAALELLVGSGLVLAALQRWEQAVGARAQAEPRGGRGAEPRGERCQARARPP